MIEDIFSFIKTDLERYLDQINTHLDLSHEIMTFPELTSDGVRSLPLEKITVFLLHYEQDAQLRTPDPYIHRTPNGQAQRVSPEIRLNLLLLFVPRFKDYKSSLRYLSLIIEYFRQNRFFDPHKNPDIPSALGECSIELVTPTLTEQKDIWTALQSSTQPCVLYRLRSVVFQNLSAPAISQIKKPTIKISIQASDFTQRQTNTNKKQPSKKEGTS